MDPYEYFDHPYWDTRKSRRPGKKYVNPYMPVPSEVAKHGSEFSDLSMARPHQHFQEISALGEGGTVSRPASATSDNTRVEGTSSNFDVDKMTRREIQEPSVREQPLRLIREARGVPNLRTPQPPHLHYGQLRQDVVHASDFVHQYPAHLHPQQPLQHNPGGFYHSPHTANTFQQQPQQSVGYDAGPFMTPFGHQMSPPQQHPVASAGGYQPNFYHSSAAPNQAGGYQDSPVLHPSQFNTSPSANHSAFNTPKPPNFNHSPFPDHGFTNNLPFSRRTSPQRSPQQRFARASPTPAATPGQMSPKNHRQLTLDRLHLMEITKKTLLAKHRDLNYERDEIEARIGDMKIRNMADGKLNDDDQALLDLMETLGRVEGWIETAAKDWDWVEAEVEEACAEIAVGGWN